MCVWDISPAPCLPAIQRSVCVFVHVHVLKGETRLLIGTAGFVLASSVVLACMSVSCVVSVGAANGYRERVDSSGVLLQDQTATAAEAGAGTRIRVSGIP